jgi:hypothetical protein
VLKNDLDNAMLNIRNVIKMNSQQKYVDLEIKITSMFQNFVKIQLKWENYLNNNNQNDNEFEIKNEEDQLIIKMDKDGETIDWEQKEEFYSIKEKEIKKKNAILIAIQVLFSLGMISYGIAGKFFIFQTKIPKNKTNFSKKT